MGEEKRGKREKMRPKIREIGAERDRERECVFWSSRACHTIYSTSSPLNSTKKRNQQIVSFNKKPKKEETRDRKAAQIKVSL